MWETCLWPNNQGLSLFQVIHIGLKHDSRFLSYTHTHTHKEKNKQQNINNINKKQKEKEKALGFCWEAWFNDLVGDKSHKAQTQRVFMSLKPF